MNPTPLNYSTQAIEDFKRMVEFEFKSYEDPFLRSESRHNLVTLSRFFKLLTELLHDAVKFTLPDNGRLMETSDKVATITPKQLELLMLPFPIIALEYSAPMLNDRLSGDHAPSGKRISLAFDVSKISDKHMDAIKRVMPVIDKDKYADMIAVLSIYHKEDKGWEASLGAILINGESEFKNMIDENNERYTRVGSVPAALDMFFPNDKEAQYFIDSLGSDTADEAIALVEFCAIMNCSNVETQVIKSPDKLNKKRVASGKLPLYDYHVLLLNPTGDNTSGVSSGGSHASPRMHLRRGHIRRLGEKRIIWVNAAVIGKKSDGVVEKSYSLDSSKDSVNTKKLKS